MVTSLYPSAFGGGRIVESKGVRRYGQVRGTFPEFHGRAGRLPESTGVVRRGSRMDVNPTRLVVTTDRDLLRAFADRADGEAFAVLVERHGPLVLGVCRRMLAGPDADDAFQAT